MGCYYVYILRGSNGKFYKGITSNLNKRLHQHELGQTQTTKEMRKFELVHVEICLNRREEREFEKFFKSGFGREILKELFDK